MVLESLNQLYREILFFGEKRSKVNFYHTFRKLGKNQSPENLKEIVSVVKTISFTLIKFSI